MRRGALKFVRWIVYAVLATLAAIVAIANRQPVTFSFDPLPFAIEVPLYSLLFGGLLTGLLIGIAGEWWRERHHRRAAREERRRAQWLNAENESLKAESARPVEVRPGVTPSPPSA